jgi:hypothetical protein
MAQAPAPLPTNLYGLSGNITSDGHVGGSGFYAQLVSQATQLYSFTSYDANLVKVNGKLQIQNSGRTGGALVIRRAAAFALLGFAQAGVASTTVATATASTTTSGAFSGGGLVTFAIGSTKWIIGAGVEQLKGTSGQTVTVYHLFPMRSQ